MKKILLAVFLVAVLTLAACSTGQSGATEISFLDLSEKIDEDEYGISRKMKDLEGETVEVVGYMSPLTPLNANYFYMIQVPGAACPFCDGADVDFLMVIQVYSPDGNPVAFENEAVKVTGTLEVGEHTDESNASSYFRIRADKIEKQN